MDAHWRVGREMHHSLLLVGVGASMIFAAVCGVDMGRLVCEVELAARDVICNSARAFAGF